MKRHLFLTGEKGVGKSTLLNKLLQNDPRKKGGFLTKRLLSEEDGLMYTHLLKPGEKPSRENILFCCNGPDLYDPIQRFEELGLAALSEECELILMDELGPHEEQALRFQQAVFEILDKEIPVRGVLQKADSAFLDRIAAHPQVEVMEVTLENRDFLFTE